MKLLLFDIDGTLIHSSRLGRTIIGLALNDVIGKNGHIEDQSFAGKTDLAILTDLMLALGYSNSELTSYLPKIYASMVFHAQAVLTSQTLVACPGVISLLEKLQDQPNIVLGIQTGNIEGTASLKLIAAQISPELFVLGAYGSDARAREDLVRLAWSRAHDRFGFDSRSDVTIVIGDTPADIASAQANGATSVAVATGIYTSELLAEAGPDFLVNDFSDLEQSLALFLE